MEQVDARLTTLGLISTAKHATDPDSVKAIIDLDLSVLPVLPTTHRDYYRNLETRMKWQQINATNEQKRQTLRFEAWTKIYTLLKISSERTAPVLSRKLLLRVTNVTIQPTKTDKSPNKSPNQFHKITNARAQLRQRG